MTLLVLMSIVVQVDGLLGKMAGPVYGGQVTFLRSRASTPMRFKIKRKLAVVLDR